MKSRLVVWSFLFICLLSGPVAGADNANPADKPIEDSPWLRKVIFGIALQDTGPISDKNESGVDPNWELQFNPPRWKWWRWIGSPFTIVGITPNFEGGTSQLYAALNYEISLSTKLTDALTFNLTKTLFISLAVGPRFTMAPCVRTRSAASKPTIVDSVIESCRGSLPNLAPIFSKITAFLSSWITCRVGVWGHHRMRESITLGFVTTMSSRRINTSSSLKKRVWGEF